MNIKPLLAAVAIPFTVLAGCSEADVASRNISTEADNFTILRRVVFVNGVTDKYLLSIEGYCAINADNTDQQIEVTCKYKDGYKKHYMGLSDNVTYVVEHMDASKVSGDYYKLVFRPTTLIPDIDLR